MISRIVNVINLLNEKTGRGVSFLFIPITVVCTIEVVMRYLFNSPTIWAWEVDTQLFCYLTALGAGYTLRQGGHVRVEIFVNLFSARTRQLIEVIVDCVFLVVIAILSQQTGRMAISSIVMREQSSSYWVYPLYPTKIIIAIGVFFLFLQGLAQLHAAWKKFVSVKQTEAGKIPLAKGGDI